MWLPWTCCLAVIVAYDLRTNKHSLYRLSFADKPQTSVLLPRTLLEYTSNSCKTLRKLLLGKEASRYERTLQWTTMIACSPHHPPTKMTPTTMIASSQNPQPRHQTHTSSPPTSPRKSPRMITSTPRHPVNSRHPDRNPSLQVLEDKVKAKARQTASEP